MLQGQVIHAAWTRGAAAEPETAGQPLLLRYCRRLRLSAAFGGEAGFRAAVDGEIVDAASRADPGEDEWTTRSVAIPNLGSRRATLEFQITVSSNLNYFPSAEAR